MNMVGLHQAKYYEPLEAGRVLCTLCPHDCRIAEGGRGACGVRYNHAGKLYSLVYDKLVASNVEPVEKKPLFHFCPGSTAYSIATVGCNLRCAFCQNWDISQWPKQHLPKRLAASGQEEDIAPICPQLLGMQRQIPGKQTTPQQIVAAALDSGASSIAYTFTEPTIFYELAIETARLARTEGLYNIFVSNGYISEAPLRELSQVLDAANIDLKFFQEKSYRHISRVKMQPILDAIRLYYQLGVWLEVTTLVIPEINDSEQELRDIAEFIHSISPDIPWHVSQFYPAHKMRHVPVTSLGKLQRAVAIGKAAGLRYVYLGNVVGAGGENTICYQCGAILIERYGSRLLANHTDKGMCPACGTSVAGITVNG